MDIILQPLYKGQLQRLLLNLCAHHETRTSLVKILMDMLMLDTRKRVNNLSAAEPSFRLYACQTNVMYSRPQSFDGKTSNLTYPLMCKCWLLHMIVIESSCVEEYVEHSL